MKILLLILLFPICASANDVILAPFQGRADYFMHYTGAGMATYTGYHVLKRYTDRALWISSGLVLALSLAKELFVDDRVSWGDLAYSSAGIITAGVTIKF